MPRDDDRKRFVMESRYAVRVGYYSLHEILFRAYISHTTGVIIVHVHILVVTLLVRLKKLAF